MAIVFLNSVSSVTKYNDKTLPTRHDIPASLGWFSIPTRRGACSIPIHVIRIFPIRSRHKNLICLPKQMMEQLLSLRDLLQHEIDDLYSAEEQIIAALPKMISAAGNPDLKAALSEHLQITEKQKQRLDQVKKLLEKNQPKEPGFFENLFGSTKCKGMEGLIKEGDHLMKQNMDADVKDAAIIASAQKIEHYEICGYGTARAYAMQLELAEVETLLTQTLNEEYEADDNLTALAFFDVNLEAENAGRGPRAARRK